MKIHKVLLLILPLILSAGEIPSFPTDVQYYTVQIKSFPSKERDKAKELYETLKKKNYLVYSQYKSLKDGNYYRIRVELFKELSKAKEFAEKFKKEESFDYFIDKANIPVIDYNDQFSIITTPQSIVYRKKDELIYLTVGRQTDLSSDGKKIVFGYNYGIYTMDIETREKKLIKSFEQDSDEALNLQPKWSPDGKYVAYLVNNGWELHTELYVINSDGTDERCLIPYDQKKQRSIKSFLWDLTENKIYYVFGSTFGTITVGGNIYETDLQGDQNIVVPATGREEIMSDFRIVSCILYYKLVIFDEDYLEREFQLNSINICDH